MKKKQRGERPIADELSPAEIQKILLKIGKQIHARRKARTSLEAFSYEINVSRSAMTGYEAGKDMYLSTFLKLMYGLDVKPEEFFKELR